MHVESRRVPSRCRFDHVYHVSLFSFPLFFVWAFDKKRETSRVFKEGTEKKNIIFCIFNLVFMSLQFTHSFLVKNALESCKRRLQAIHCWNYWHCPRSHGPNDCCSRAGAEILFSFSTFLLCYIYWTELSI